jgi:pimeloyl-ACP methyl ester carboxylesterase
MRLHLSLLSAALVAGALAVPAVGATPAPAPTTTDACINSVPDKGSSTPQKICYTLFKPGNADSTHRVPLIFHSHGWGGSRTKDAASFADWLDAGFGVLSFDQRGFGEDGGKARIENPDYEGKDVAALVSLVSNLSWVQQDAPGDPRIGAIGGSYGGGYQFVGAFRELMDHGKPLFDALAPEITWWDLKQSLAPNEIVRTEWVSALSAAGAQALPNEALRGLAYGAATGEWPQGQNAAAPNLDAFFAHNGPAWHVANGRRLNIPVLFGQGETDNLFPLTQGLRNFAGALTSAAKAKSIFVGYNGGHTLPSATPPGYGVAGDPCSITLGSDTFAALSLRFMQKNLKGATNTGLTGFGRYHLATADGACVTVDSVKPNKNYALPNIITTTGGGAPIATKIATGPLHVAGSPVVNATVTVPTGRSRAFYALAVGTTAADAKIVQNNMMPLNERHPVTGVQRVIELPSIAVDVPAGQSLFLLASPVSDMFAGFQSRTPGVISLTNVVVRLPIV